MQATATGDVRVVPGRLLASWQRSEDYGVPLEAVEPVFTGTDDQESLFFECGNEVLADLHRTLANEPVSLMLTDADGLVLSRLSGDHRLLRALDDVHLAPGFAYSERDVGTNGLGLALADRVPTLVRAEEHYSLSLCTYTCAAVPVLDPPTGRLEGSVNLTTWSRSSSDLLLALAQSAAEQHRGADARPLAAAAARGRRRAARCSGSRCRGSSRARARLHALSAAWNARGRRSAERAMAAGRVVAAVGEPGVGPGHAAGAGGAAHLPARPDPVGQRPAPHDVQTVAGAVGARARQAAHRGRSCATSTCCRAWVAERLRDLVVRHGRRRRTPCRSRSPPSASRTSRRRWRAWSTPWSPVPPLRERPDDVLPLAAARRHASAGPRASVSPRRRRGRCSSYDWPGNVDQLAAGRPRTPPAAPTSSTSAPAAGGARRHHPSPVPDRGVRARRDHPGARRRPG